MTTTTTLTRSAVLAYRAGAHGLDRAAGRAFDLPALALGVQDSPPGSARLALAARLPGATATAPATEPAWWELDDRLGGAWTIRGAPHVHRITDLASLGAALWPLDDADASARLAWNATRVRESGVPPLRALELAAAAVAEVAARQVSTLDATGLADDEPVGLTKGLLSREVTRLLPAELRRWCEPCGVMHLSEQLLRLATLPGGLMIDGTAPLTFVPIPGRAGVPTAPERGDRLVRSYLRLYGPATPADAKAFFGASLAAVKACWPPDAVEVQVEGRRAWTTADDLPVLLAPPTPPRVRLLPPNDAFLKAGDRAVLVPGRAEQKQIWRILGSPGVLLLSAAPAGIWRPRAGAKRLDVTVTPFAPLDARTVRLIEQEADRMAVVRNLGSATVTIA